MTTFDSLGIPFPLFKGPIEDCSEYAGEGECSLCSSAGYLFRLAIGADVVTQCPSCRQETAVDADDREDKCGTCHEEWVKVPLPREVLMELTRTPSYHTWQGETWLFHNDKPMVYLGSWGKAEFIQAAPDGDGRALFLATVGLRSRSAAHDTMVWDSLGSSAAEAGSPAVYVFRPQDGDGPLRAAYDFD